MAILQEEGPGRTVGTIRPPHPMEAVLLPEVPLWWGPLAPPIKIREHPVRGREVLVPPQYLEVREETPVREIPVQEMAVRGRLEVRM